MTTTFRTIIMAHFVNCKIDDPVSYLAERGSITEKTVTNYFRAANHPIGSRDGLSVQIAWWLIGECRHAISGDAAGLPNQVEKILTEKLDEYHSRRANKRRKKRPQPRQRSRGPRSR